MAADPPDYFVLANVDMSEFGPSAFGFNAHYGLRTRLWLEQNYELVADIGEKDETRRPGCGSTGGRKDTSRCGCRRPQATAPSHAQVPLHPTRAGSGFVTS